MTIAELLLPEVDQEMATTRRVLERVPNDRLAWKPHDKSSSMGELASHIVNMIKWTDVTMNATEFDIATVPPDQMNPVAASRAQLLEWFDANAAAARAALQSAEEGVSYTEIRAPYAGIVTKRNKGPSKAHRVAHGHTPLSLNERLPWGGTLLIVGTGASGQLPVMPGVVEEAERRGIRIEQLPTLDACHLLQDIPADQVHAVLHVTC